MTQPSPSRTLFLHVGHGKTGSSFLQSCLALSAEALEAAGIAYPMSGKDRAKAVAGHVNRGNFPPLEKGHHLPEQAKAALAPEMWGDHDKLLLSNEALFGSIRRFDFLDHLREEVDRAGDTEIRILCYIRNPLDHALSAYQQKLKEGRPETASEFLATFGVTRQVGMFLDLVRVAGIEPEIVNYNTSRARLLDRMADWLGMEIGAFTTPAVKSVNRSMTRTEMEFQRAFNKHFGSKARQFVSDALSNALPDIRSEKPFLEEDALAAFLHRTQTIIADINPRLPETERYHLPTLEEARQDLPGRAEAETLTLRPEQIEVMARSMAETLGVTPPPPPKHKSKGKGKGKGLGKGRRAVAKRRSPA